MAKKNTDTVAAMLTPGEVVLNADQQKRLGELVGMPVSEVFKKIGVPGFAKGGKVLKSSKKYQGGGVANTPIINKPRIRRSPFLAQMKEVVKMAKGGRVGKPMRSDIYRGIYLANMRNK